MPEVSIEVHERLAVVETNVSSIMTNHLPHIQSRVDKVDKRLWWVLATIVIGFLSTIAVVLIKGSF